MPYAPPRPKPDGAQRFTSTRRWRRPFATLLISLWATSSLASDSPRVAANGIVVDASWEDRSPPPPLAELLSEAGRHRIIAVRGEADFTAHRRLVVALERAVDLEALLLPVGIFEGHWIDRSLRRGAPPEEAARTVYRVWREDPAFLTLLRTLGTETDLEVLGTLCRFHAVGKSLYPDHLEEFLGDALPAPILDEFRQAFGGTERLSRASADDRKRAAAAYERLAEAFTRQRQVLVARHGEARVRFEQQLLDNVPTFLTLEQIRAGELPEDPGFEAREVTTNLDWILEQRHPTGTVLLWIGRGQEVLPLPETGVFTLEFTAVP